MSVESFLTADVRGKHIALGAPQQQLKACLRRYLLQKNDSPETTALCVAVHPSQTWAVKRYLPAAVPVYAFDDNTRLWCDPPASSVVCGKAYVASARVPMMTFQGRVRKWQARILVDSGASRCFIHSKFAQAVGLTCRTAQRSVILADGSKVPAKAECDVPVRIDGHRCIVTAYVIDLATEFDLILGDTWLSAHDAVLSYRHRLCHVRQGKGYISLVPASVRRRAADTSSLDLLTRSQLGRALRYTLFRNGQEEQAAKRDNRAALLRQAFLVHVRPQPFDDGDEQPGEAVPHARPTGPAALPAHLTREEAKLLKEYRDVFNEDIENRPVADFSAGEHVIELEPGAKPPFRPIFRYSQTELQEIESTVSKLLKAGWIEPTVSPFGAPVLFVPKKDGTLRMCIDYRALNKVTVRNRYPLPRIDQLLDQLSGATVFSSLDLQSGYHLLRIREADVPKTAFRVPCVGPYGGSYAYRVLPMGLTNAPATFQNAMNKVFGKHLGRFVCVYLDDILVFSKSRTEHVRHLAIVMDLLRKHRLYCKLSKCSFAQEEVKFLGHIVGKNGVQMDPSKVAVVQAWPQPTTVSELRSFLGLATYFRKFVQGFATLVRPLHLLTKATATWVWTPACEKAFQGVKYALTHAPVLAMPDFKKPFEVICDASLVGIGAVLLQEGRPVAFESRKLIPAEVNYLTTEQELLAVVHALTTWRCFLEGVEFTVVTDHNPLTFFPSQPTLSRRQARWAELLSRYRFKWEYRPGRTNVADPLSRVPTHKDEAHACVAHLFAVELRPRNKPAAQPPPAPLAPKPKRRARSAPARPNPTAEAAEPKPPPPPVMGPLTGDLRAFREAYKSDPWFDDPRNLEGLHKGSNGLWYKGDKLVIPDVQWIKEGIMYEMHDAPYSGHVGVRKTTKLVQRMYWWPGLTADVDSYVKACHSCQRTKVVQKKPGGLLQPLPIPNEPWESISMDWITSLPPTARGHDAILVFVCRLTKMVHIAPTTSKITAQGTAELFAQEVWKHHGLPRDIVSDRDPRLTSHFWQAVMKYLGTKTNMSTAFHPQSDGQTERVNRVLEDMLRHFVDPRQDDWDLLLPTVEFAINNSYHESTKDTPFRLVYGRDPATPLALGHKPKVKAAHEWADRMMQGLAEAKKCLQAAQQRQKTYADTRRRPVQFAVGDEVLLSTVNIKFKGALSRKLLPRWVGPYRIVRALGPVAYELELPPTMKIHNVFHVSLLRQFHPGTRQQKPPAPVVCEEDGEEYYLVDRVIDHRDRSKGKKRVREFLVRWKGYGVEDDTWEPEEALTELDALQAYKTFAGL